MQWVSAFIDSVSAVLAGEKPSIRSQHGCERARAALLELMDGHSGHEAARIRQRILAAKRPDVLWLMRSDVVQHLTRTCGEVTARERVMALTPLWDGRISSGYLIAQHRHRLMTARLADGAINADQGNDPQLPERRKRWQHVRFS